jgi:hypothetical protein
VNPDVVFTQKYQCVFYWRVRAKHKCPAHKARTL